MNPVNVAFLLAGIVIGALSVPVLAGVWLWWREVRSAVREGTQLVGDGLERAKRRSE